MLKKTLLYLNVAVTALGEYFSDILGNYLKLIQSGYRFLNTIDSCFFASQNTSSVRTNFITFFCKLIDWGGQFVDCPDPHMCNHVGSVLEVLFCSCFGFMLWYFADMTLLVHLRENFSRIINKTRTRMFIVLIYMVVTTWKKINSILIQIMWQSQFSIRLHCRLFTLPSIVLRAQFCMVENCLSYNFIISQYAVSGLPDLLQ